MAISRERMRNSIDEFEENLEYDAQGYGEDEEPDDKFKYCLAFAKWMRLKLALNHEVSLADFGILHYILKHRWNPFQIKPLPGLPLDISELEKDIETLEAALPVGHELVTVPMAEVVPA